ncbi:hypothetical protein PSK87_14955 [Escherichia coli]|nr:hypothetical protein [Escherichia coli]
MKSVKGLSDIQDFFNWMWAVDPRLASRLNDLHDYYRRACKQAARSAATYGDFSFTVDDRYRVDVRDQNHSLGAGPVPHQRVRQQRYQLVIVRNGARSGNDHPQRGRERD